MTDNKINTGIINYCKNNYLYNIFKTDNVFFGYKFNEYFNI